MSLSADELETRRALYALTGVLIESEHGRGRVVEPFDRPVIPLGAVNECAVRVELRLIVRELRLQWPRDPPCTWCKKSRGWKHCREHELIEALERAACCLSDLACACDWAYALGYYWSSERSFRGYWTEAEPRAYVRGCTDDASDYSRAIYRAL